MTSVPRVVAAYLDHLEAEVGASVHTVAAYRRDLARYASWLDEQGVRAIDEVDAAQVAAFADDHFVVAKASDGQVTTSGINRVDGAARLDELARMMAGLEGSANAHAHAAELLSAAGH